MRWKWPRAGSRGTASRPAPGSTACPEPGAVGPRPPPRQAPERKKGALRLLFAMPGTRQAQTRSMISAMPCPTPMHIVHSA
ncbi:Uncharacterised protein [Bordetella pertussis]|nr:Uncharacterised protein [Bordetella pertussis]